MNPELMVFKTAVRRFSFILIITVLVNRLPISPTLFTFEQLIQETRKTAEPQLEINIGGGGRSNTRPHSETYFCCDATSEQLEAALPCTSQNTSHEIPTIVKMKWCLFVCLWFDNATRKFCTKMNCTPGSDVGLSPFRYLYPFKYGGHFSGVTTCQIRTFLQFFTKQ